MILRSITRHVRDQNWFAVGLDFVIVVVGVFIGIQVANWNEERLLDARSETAKARLVQNIQDDLDIMERRANFFRGVSEFGEHANRVFEGPEPATDEARWVFLVALFQAGQIWPWQVEGQVYKEMQSAGQLDLIGGPEIRSALSRYYDEAGAEIGITFGGIDPYRSLIRRRMPWSLQKHLWDRCYDFQASQQGARRSEDILLRCALPEELASMRAAAQQLHRDQEVAEFLRGRLSELLVTLSSIDNITMDGLTLIEQVEQRSPEGTE